MGGIFLVGCPLMKDPPVWLKVPGGTEGFVARRRDAM
jgi:hypothetical protein